MTRLESTQKINNLKVQAIKNGGYERHKDQILKACALHKKLFGNQRDFIDLTPSQWKKGKLSGSAKTEEIFELPDGSMVRSNRQHLRREAEKSIKLYETLRKEPGWEAAASEELKYWQFIYKQVAPLQISARKKVTINSKPKKKMATKKPAAKTATKKKRPSVKTACRKLIRQEGVKADGTLKKGYKYKKGGGVVKVKAKPVAKKKVAAKKPAKRKPATKKK